MYNSLKSLKQASSMLFLSTVDGEDFNSKTNIFVYDLALH